MNLVCLFLTSFRLFDWFKNFPTPLGKGTSQNVGLRDEKSTIIRHEFFPFSQTHPTSFKPSRHDLIFTSNLTLWGQGKKRALWDSFVHLLENHIWVSTWVSVCTHMYTYVGICIYTYVGLHMYTQTHTYWVSALRTHRHIWVSESTHIHGPAQAASTLLFKGHVMPGWEEGRLFASHWRTGGSMTLKETAQMHL